jgi:hypothetical protein
MTPVADTHETGTISPAALARLNQAIEEAFGRQPRYNYFQRGNGPMFCWTVEKNPGDGKYASFVYKPIGKGARSGKATRWELVERKTVEHSKRKAAKARALRLYRAWAESAS